MDTLGFLAAAALALAALAQFGCAAPLPATYSVDTEFTMDQQREVHEALQDWCDAVGWCPFEVSDGELHISVASDYARINDTPGSRGFETDNVSISVNPGGSAIFFQSEFLDDFPECFGVTIRHELGHVGIDQHTQMGLMKASHDLSECTQLDKRVDTFARMAWCKNSGC